MNSSFEDDASVTTQAPFGSAPRTRRLSNCGVEVESPRTAKVAAVVLAAGASSRFCRAPSKLVADFAGKPLIRHAVEAVGRSRASPIFVVTGHAREDIRRALEGTDVMFVHNEHYSTGMASSLRAGVRALPRDADGVVIALADMPKVGSPLIDALISTFANRDADAVAPVFDGRRGNPVLLSRRLFARVAALCGDEGARRMLSVPEVDTVLLDVPDAAIMSDVDRLEDLEQLARA